MRTALFLAVLLHALSGCAVLAMQPPKVESPSEPPRCSESRGGVVLDGAFVALYGVLAIAAMSNEEGALAIPPLLLGGLHLGSAVAGSSAATRCTEAHEAHAEWLAQERRERALLANAEARDRRRQGAPGDEERVMGTQGAACYPNMTCNLGLECDRLTKLCAVPEPAATTPAAPAVPEPATTTPAAPAAASPEDSRTNEPEEPARPRAATRPSGSTSGSTQPPAPGSRPRGSDTPRKAPPAPTGEGSWGDFWREVKP